MASREDTTSNNNKKMIVSEIPSYICHYSDGTVERPREFPRVPPSPEDPITGVSSKDIVFSEDPYLTARLFLPKLTESNQRIPILVYYHGGAFCFESASSTHHHNYCNIIASQGNVIVVSIEHRKAPEHYLPAAYDDCWAGLKWVASHSSIHENPTNSDPWLINHGDFSKVFLGGESSGANYVHNIAIRAGVETLPGGIKVYGAYLNHPCFWGSKPIGSEPVIGFEESVPSQIWNFTYPNAPGGLDNPLLNPLAPGAPDLGGLGCSKMFIAVAGKDYLHFRDRAVLYYEAVKASGWKGEVELFEEEEEDHVYHMYHPETPQGKRLLKKVTDFLRESPTSITKGA